MSIRTSERHTSQTAQISVTKSTTFQSVSQQSQSRASDIYKSIVTTLIEIAIEGIEKGNPLVGHAAYAVWVERALITQGCLRVHGVPRGSNMLCRGAALRLAMEVAYPIAEAGPYSLAFYGCTDIQPLQLAAPGKRNKFYDFYLPFKYAGSMVVDAVSVKEIPYYTRAPKYVTAFRKAQDGWIFFRDEQRAVCAVQDVKFGFM